MAEDSGSELVDFYEDLAYADRCLGDIQNQAENVQMAKNFEAFDGDFPTSIRDGRHVPKGIPTEVGSEENISEIKANVRSLLRKHLCNESGDTGVTTPFSINDPTLSTLQAMDEFEFEQLVADILEIRGWNASVTQDRGDRGIDIVIKKYDPFFQKMLVQAKRYSAENKVHSQEIRKYSTLKNQENRVDAVILATTSSFTSPAQDLAKDLNIKIVNGSKIIELIEDVQSS